MSNLLVNMRDQEFVLFEQLNIEKLFDSELFSGFSKDDVLMMQKEAERVAINVILPTYAEGDKTGCELKDGKVHIPSCFKDPYKKFVEGGWSCGMRSPDVGGQGMPMVLTTAYSELFCAANFAFLMYPMLTNGAAGLIEEFGTEVQKNKYMYKMYSGEWTGTMCLTEPDAGSDLGALRTVAIRLSNGTFSIVGTKCFISCGDHDLTGNIVHMVLARIEGDPAGTEGLSIFIVPKYRVKEDGSIYEFNDISTGTVEHKMGIKGSATCLLNFGEDGNCVGELLGRERQGLKIMFHLMNEARLEVGMQSLGHASTAYEHAVQYAKERIQSVPVWEMKNPAAKAVAIIAHPDIRRKLLLMKAYVEGIRALNYYAAFCMDMARIAEKVEDKERWQGLEDLLIPICKAYSSDTALRVCSMAIDVYGGYGYMSEYPVEQYLRDCKIASIYEGTNGIQALDLVGRKLSQRKGMNTMNIFGEIKTTVAETKIVENLKKEATYLEDANNALIDLTMHFAVLAKSSGFMLPVLNASPYLELFGDLLVGHFLLQGAAIAEGKLQEIYAAKGAEESKGRKRSLVHQDADVAFYEGKVSAAKFFAVNILTGVKARCEALKIGDKTPIEIADESFVS